MSSLPICLCELPIRNFHLLPYVLSDFSIASCPMEITAILILENVWAKPNPEDDSSLNRFKAGGCVNLNWIFVSVDYICCKYFLPVAFLSKSFTGQKFHSFMYKQNLSVMLLRLEVPLENSSLLQDSQKVFLYLSSLIPCYVLILFIWHLTNIYWVLNTCQLR